MPILPIGPRLFDSPRLTRLWTCYNALPPSIREQADRAYELLKVNLKHPSLHLRQVGRFWSARVGLQYRAVGVDAADGIVWFWIGAPAEYDKLMR
ncbi:MAG: hypothetical protein P0119_14390 [Nitrospira sp.]|nr:hypothetical protein [Nitrospira sp.]